MPAARWQRPRLFQLKLTLSHMVLPAIVLGVFSLVQPGYAYVLFYDPTGQLALKIAIGLDAMAFFTIRRILKVDY